MIEKEANNLKLANKYGIGQKLYYFDVNARCLVLEHIVALPFNLWLEKAKKEEIRKRILECLRQALILDKIKLDHGQLAGTGTNIIVKKNALPVIVDFEKASISRKPHNLNVMFDFLLLGNNRFAKKIRNTLDI